MEASAPCSQAGGPDGGEGGAPVGDRRAAADGRRGKHSGLPEVFGDDAATVVVAGVEPAADGLGGEDAVAERADEPAVGPEHPSDVTEHVDRTGEVVDRGATDDVVHALVA